MDDHFYGLEPLLSEVEAAHVLNLSPATLKQDRSRKLLGVPYIRLGRVVRYRPEDLRGWIAERRRVPQAVQARPRGGRPTRSEQVEAEELGITVPQLRARKAGGEA